MLARPKRFVLVLFSLALVAILSVPGRAQEPQAPLPRRPLPKTPLEYPRPKLLWRVLNRVFPPVSLNAMEASEKPFELMVKFQDQVKARATRAGKLSSLSQANLTIAQDILDRFGLTVSAGIEVPAESLSELEEFATQRIRIHQPDFAGILRVGTPQTDISILKKVGEQLQDLPEVEFTTIRLLDMPPPAQVTPTPDLLASQTYREAGAGMNIQAARDRGLSGAGIRLSDCEYGWNAAHEDLKGVTITLEAGQTLPSHLKEAESFFEHGTAVLGMLAANDDGVGTTGLIPEAEFHFYPEWNGKDESRRATAILQAVKDSDPGDVILLEMQENKVGGYAPAEIDQTIWLTVRTATDKGVVVVAAAGNGDQSLDSHKYRFHSRLGDSGAIVVGAGSSDNFHDRLDFSTYGSRVDVQGWGENVFTLGYGEFEEYDGDKNRRYTHLFDGTSSASPMVAAAAVLIQEWAIKETGKPFSPQRVRKILRRTGRVQGDSTEKTPIGAFVDLERVLSNAEVLNDDFSERLALPTNSNRLAANNENASDEPFEGQKAAGRSIWWKWTATDNGQMTLDVSNSSFVASLDVYKGTGKLFSAIRNPYMSRDNVENITVSNHLRGNRVATRKAEEGVTFAATKGIEYQIRVDGSGGDVVLEWEFKSDPSRILWKLKMA